jgi:hypothetical protein
MLSKFRIHPESQLGLMGDPVIRKRKDTCPKKHKSQDNTKPNSVSRKGNRSPKNAPERLPLKDITPIITFPGKKLVQNFPHSGRGPRPPGQYPQRYVMPTNPNRDGFQSSTKHRKAPNQYLSIDPLYRNLFERTTMDPLALLTTLSLQHLFSLLPQAQRKRQH